MNPSVVARQVRTPALILAAWAIGGAIALAGAFVYAELAALRPAVGGQYAYLRDAFGPLVAFLYGWGLLLVIQSGGMAAVAVTFAHYARELVAVPLGVGALATLVLLALTVVNCLGAGGATLQSALMVFKIVAIVGLAGGRFFFAAPVQPAPLQRRALRRPWGLVPLCLRRWRTSSFVAGSWKRPERDSARPAVGVVESRPLAVSAVCLRAWDRRPRGPRPPASEVMRRWNGRARHRGGDRRVHAGFLSPGMLTAPRVYTPWPATASSSEPWPGSIPARACPSRPSPCRGSWPWSSPSRDATSRS
jgi:APA family basic amino acid/polyamine antiporter